MTVCVCDLVLSPYVCAHLIYLMQLLHDQVGVVEFVHYRPLFMLYFSQGRVAFSGIPLLPPLFGYPHRNWCVAQHDEMNGVVIITVKLLYLCLPVYHEMAPLLDHF